MGLLYCGGWFGVGHSDGLVGTLWVHLERGKEGERGWEGGRGWEDREYK